MFIRVNTERQVLAHQSATERVGSAFFVIGAQQAVAVPLLLEGVSGRSMVFRLSGVPLDVPSNSDCEQFVLPQGGYSLDNFRVYRLAIRKLHELRSRCTELHVYVPHVFHSMANFAAIDLKPDQVHLLPDGVLNYYDVNVDLQRRLHMGWKALIMKLCGGRYRFYTGALTGADAVDYSSTYTFNEAGLRTRYGRICPLRLAPVKPAGAGEAVLFVDQPLHTLRKTLRQAIEAQVTQYLNSRKVVYKAHVSQDQPSVPIPDDVEILPKDRPVESLLDGLPISEVVSVSSSALLTLKQLNPSLHCTAVGIEHLANEKPELARVRDTMLAAGIRCL